MTGKTKIQETKTLVQWLIEQIDGEAYRAGKLSGEKHPSVTGELFRIVGGRADLVSQARELEKDAILGRTGRIRFQWRDLNTDIKTIHCSVDIMPELCKREGIEDPRTRQLRYIKIIEEWQKRAEDTWLFSYYDNELRKLKEGKCAPAVQKNLEDGYLYRCLDEILSLKEPAEKRIFSARIFKNVKLSEEKITPSKIFEKKYQSKVISILKEYSPECADGMSDDEILKAHGILSYAQTLEWKGNLTYLLDGTITVNTSQNRYGTIVGAQTLEHAVPESLPGVKKIFIIENKANYEKAQFKESELYIFCHGFFSPKEVRFLKKICDAAETGTQYFHWGDMDYGGIRIFRFNRENVFPELKPYKIEREDYENAIAGGAGVPIEDEKKKKLEKLEAGELEELKNCILESGMEIEQELLL